MSNRVGRRAVVLVIDACGAGALPDAAAYGDEGSNTLAHLAAAVGGLELPVMGELGLGSILALEGVAPSADPAIHGRLAPLGPGKDSITGHWELMGVTLDSPLPTYPRGFPAELVGRLEAAMGMAVICNRPDNGLAAIEEFGPEHLRTGALILYTSQDSVLQLAAHTDRLPVAELYGACAAARELMSGPDAVGRVIARPFTGSEGHFVRTLGRRDLALAPPGRSYLEELEGRGIEVMAVGKVDDLFASRGVGSAHPGSDNAQALESVERLLDEGRPGLIFANLIETDQVYGHRKDTAGFHGALRLIDAAAGRIIAGLRGGDLLIMTADHGVDPAHPGTDHTREHVPLLALSGEMAAAAAAGGSRGGFRHDGPMADVGATVLDWLTGEGAGGLPGGSFIS
jgi:phosphopentomutase